jgi:ATP-dependent Clp protease ATP-binding subunit ClpC
MTSNLGADRIQQHTRQKESFDELRTELMEILQRSFRPEFINRIDEIIVFHALTAEQLTEITRLMLDRVARRLHAQHIDVEFTDAAVRFLADEGFDPEFGARPLRRTIQRFVDNELSRMLLSGELEPGDGVTADERDGSLQFEVSRGASSLADDTRERAGAAATI